MYDKRYVFRAWVVDTDTVSLVLDGSHRVDRITHRDVSHPTETALSSTRILMRREDDRSWRNDSAGNRPAKSIAGIDRCKEE